jgi:aminoglycoside 3-N-acetyltransferase|tara:strand:- start:494 stop:1315 length:822 start_codon:yes stop_codon:yes gene_type:complete
MIKPDNPIFVHSDIGRGLLIAKRAKVKLNGSNIFSSLLDFLTSHIDEGDNRIFFPAFNYDFGKTGVFNVNSDPSQVGVMSEWVRLNCDYKRSEIPFYSILSKYEQSLITEGTINPFGNNSIFHKLVSQDANIVLFGTDISSLTFIHYIEEIVGKPIYRYEKIFPGKIVRGNSSSQFCNISMHVRPLGVHMDYNWPKLERELLASGIMKVANYSSDFKSISARRLLEFWGNKIANDPFYLLDEKSTAYFDNVTSNGLNRVKLEDFENERVEVYK